MIARPVPRTRSLARAPLVTPLPISAIISTNNQHSLFPARAAPASRRHQQPIMTTDYLDFELELDPPTSNGSYPLSVVQSPAGNAHGTLTLPDLPDRLAQRARQGDAAGVKALGTLLFDALLTQSGVLGTYAKSLGAADAQGKSLRIKLRIVDPTLACIPWELLYDPRFGEFIALSHETPIVRYTEVAQPIRPLTVTLPLRILGMAVDPTGQLNLEAEKRAVETSLKTLVDKGVVELAWLGGDTWRDIQRALRPGKGPWHVFHFIGHGGFERTVAASGQDGERHLKLVNSPPSVLTGGEGHLLLAGDDGAEQTLAASELGRLLAGHASLRLVVLNACHGATSAPLDLFSGIAATLIRRGVPAVIAMQAAILDAAGVELGRTFYEALADGLPIEGALTEARIAVSMAQRDRLDWAAPVLYLRSQDGVLFELPTVAKPPAQPPAPTGELTGTPTVKVPDKVLKLTGAQFGAFQAALLSTFTMETLSNMVRVHLNENLGAIAGGSNLSAVIFNLIDWAQRTGHLSDLIRGALAAAPKNPDLTAFVASLGG